MKQKTWSAANHLHFCKTGWDKIKQIGLNGLSPNDLTGLDLQSRLAVYEECKRRVAEMADKARTEIMRQVDPLVAMANSLEKDHYLNAEARQAFVGAALLAAVALRSACEHEEADEFEERANSNLVAMFPFGFDENFGAAVVIEELGL